MRMKGTSSADASASVRARARRNHIPAQWGRRPPRIHSSVDKRACTPPYLS